MLGNITAGGLLDRCGELQRGFCLMLNHVAMSRVEYTGLIKMILVRDSSRRSACRLCSSLRDRCNGC